MSFVNKIDSAISYIPREITEEGKERPRRRILYFCSEDRHIIEKAINKSIYLWELLVPEKNKVKKEERYDFLKGYHMIADFQKEIAESSKQGEQEPQNCMGVRAYTLTDFHVYKDVREVKMSQLGMVKQFLDHPKYQEALLLISSPYTQIPEGMDDEIELIHLGSIDVEDIKEIIQEQLETKREEADLELDEVAKKFLGLTERQILSILDRTRNTGYCCELDAETEHEKMKCHNFMMEYIAQEKKNAMDKDSIIEFVDYKDEEEAAGLEGFCDWLRLRKRIFENLKEAEEHGVKVPNGVLLTGISGTGKTMLAKKTAKEFGNLPLIKFQLGKIQSSLYGGSTANLNRYLTKIEAMAPCVMLVDEVEKVFQNNNDTHETTKLMLSQLLGWLQDKKGLVFAFFTANDVTKVPQELFRNERISERFFVFMPTSKELASIFDSKLKQMNRKMFDNEMQKAIGMESVGSQVMERIGKNMGNRNLFLTGADVEKLLSEEVNMKLWNEGVSMPYSKKVYMDTIVKCACDKRFKPYGETNMRDIVKTWYLIKENEYRSASKENLFPFDKLIKGKELPEVSRLNSYDMELYRKIGKEIIAK